MNWVREEATSKPEGRDSSRPWHGIGSSSKTGEEEGRKLGPSAKKKVSYRKKRRGLKRVVVKRKGGNSFHFKRESYQSERMK